MTNAIDGFYLYPLPHWQDSAQAAHENIQALRRQRQHEIDNTCNGSSEKMRQVHERHDQMEKDMMKGYLQMIKMHQKFIEKHPEAKDFRGPQSHPPASYVTVLAANRVKWKSILIDIYEDVGFANEAANM